MKGWHWPYFKREVFGSRDWLIHLLQSPGNKSGYILINWFIT